MQFLSRIRLQYINKRYIIALTSVPFPVSRWCIASVDFKNVHNYCMIDKNPLLLVYCLYMQFIANYHNDIVYGGSYGVLPPQSCSTADGIFFVLVVWYSNYKLRTHASDNIILNNNLIYCHFYSGYGYGYPIGTRKQKFIRLLLQYVQY